jgi:hypothetical protein
MNKNARGQPGLQSPFNVSRPKPMSRRQAVLVLGMHRSGTSALAGVLSALGVAGPRTLVSPTESNPRGYFESPRIFTALDDMLASIGSCWDDWRQLDQQWLDSKAAQHRKSIKALLIDEYASEPIIFLKDPRICRFVPFVCSILAELNFTFVALLPLRNPLEVAYSLKRRDAFALSKSVLLWLRHVLDAEIYSRNMPRYFLQYEKFVADWRHDMDRAAQITGITWPDQSHCVSAKIDQFLTPDLRHEIALFNELENHPNVSPLVRETYKILINIAVHGEGKEFLDQLDLVRAKFEEGCRIFAPPMGAVELAATANDALIAERDSLAEDHKRLIAERDSLAEDHKRLIAERDSLAEDHKRLIAERDSLAEDHKRLIAERDALARDHKNLGAVRDAMLTSRSWRLTAPLRSLKKMIGASEDHSRIPASLDLIRAPQQDTSNVLFLSALMQRLRRPISDIALAKRIGLSQSDLKAVVASSIFDERFYQMTYPETTQAGVSPFEHYLTVGRFEKRRPSAAFDPTAYIEANPELQSSGGIEPLLHYVLFGRAAGAPLSKAEAIPPRPVLTREITFGTKRLIIFLTPGFDARVGGVLSIAGIYRESRGLIHLHGAKVALCAVPGDDPLFLKYTWFENDNYLLDLNAVLRNCIDLDYLQVHIPEYAVNRVALWLDSVSSSLLRDIGTIHLNVMVQNIDQIEGQNIGELTRFGTVTVTTAHEAYGNAATRNIVGVPLHKLGVCTGPELYDRRAYRDKEPVLVVSHDEHPLKEQVLGQIAGALPWLEIRVVHNLSYEEYRALILRAKWSLTFGEGLDGYFAEMVFSGGNGFAVYNDRFFTPAFAALETVYPSWEVLLERITADLQRLDESTAYDRCWRQAYELLSKLHGTDRFRENLRAFYRGEYSFR